MLFFKDEIKPAHFSKEENVAIVRDAKTILHIIEQVVEGKTNALKKRPSLSNLDTYKRLFSAIVRAKNGENPFDGLNKGDLFSLVSTINITRDLGQDNPALNESLEKAIAQFKEDYKISYELIEFWMQLNASIRYHRFNISIHMEKCLEFNKGKKNVTLDYFGDYWNYDDYLDRSISLTEEEKGALNAAIEELEKINDLIGELENWGYAHIRSKKAYNNLPKAIEDCYSYFTIFVDYISKHSKNEGLKKDIEYNIEKLKEIISTLTDRNALSDEWDLESRNQWGSLCIPRLENIEVALSQNPLNLLLAL